MYSEARKKAAMKYNKERREMLNLSLPKGKKEEYRQQAAEHGMSLSAYIFYLLEKDKTPIGK